MTREEPKCPECKTPYYSEDNGKTWEAQCECDSEGKQLFEKDE